MKDIQTGPLFIIFFINTMLLSLQQHRNMDLIKVEEVQKMLKAKSRIEDYKLRKTLRCGRI